MTFLINAGVKTGIANWLLEQQFAGDVTHHFQQGTQFFNRVNVAAAGQVFVCIFKDGSGQEHAAVAYDADEIERLTQLPSDIDLDVDREMPRRWLMMGTEKCAELSPDYEVWLQAQKPAETVITDV